MSKLHVKEFDHEISNSSIDYLKIKDDIYKEVWSLESRTRFTKKNSLNDSSPFDNRSVNGSTSPPSPLDDSYESSQSDLSPRSSNSSLSSRESDHILKECCHSSMITPPQSRVPFTGRCFKCDAIRSGLKLTKSFVNQYLKFVEGNSDDYLDQVIRGEYLSKESHSKISYGQEDWDKEASLVRTNFVPPSIQFEDVEEDLIKLTIDKSIEKEMKFHPEKNQYYFEKRKRYSLFFNKKKRKNYKDLNRDSLNEDDIAQFEDC
jgi:hypothetical protein